jgi:hypothetical protein
MWNNGPDRLGKMCSSLSHLTQVLPKTCNTQYAAQNLLCLHLLIISSACAKLPFMTPSRIPDKTLTTYAQFVRPVAQLPI